MKRVKTKINKAFILDAISAFARFYMAYIWLKAGFAKLGEILSVTQNITAYQIFTPEWSQFLAHLIGPFEIGGGLLLLLGLFLRNSSRVGLVVLILFITGIAQSWIRGLGIDCGCFTVNVDQEAQAMNYLRTILRDLFYVFLTVWTIRRPFSKFSVYA